MGPADRGDSFSVAIKNSMPATEPELPDPPVFEKGDEFRDFLLDKRAFLFPTSILAAAP